MSDKISQEIFDLIKSSNFKQCNVKIAQLRKQYPNSTYYEVLELYVKYKHSPSKFDYNVLNTLYGLKGSRTSSDIKALELLHTFFLEFNRFEEALHVYKKANFKYPSFEIAYYWFEKALNDFNFRHLGKACLQLIKYDDLKYNRSRDYRIWYVLSVLALFKFNKALLSDQEIKILPQLAYKTLIAAKPFQSTEECVVFCDLCETLFSDDKEKSKEIADLILPELKTSVDLYLKNYMLKHLKDNNLLFENCQFLLKSIDDYDLIKKLIVSGKQLDKSKNEIKTLITDLVGDGRNSRLSALELDLVFDNLISKDSITFYLEKFHNKQCCYVDIKRYLDKIDVSILLEIFHSFNDSDPIHDSNLFQLNIVEMDAIEYYNKHKNTLNTKPKTDYSACSIFILDIIKSCLIKDDITLKDVIFSISVLEHYQRKDIHNFDTRIWLITLYTYIGCIPLAYFHFNELKIKNVQNDTLDHLLYTRFSSLFPQKSHDYYKTLLNVEELFYGMSLDRIPSLTRIAFERRAYSKILGMLEFWINLETSSMRWLKISEMIQFARLCNDKRGNLLTEMHKKWLKIEQIKCNNSSIKQWSDNRDFDVFRLNMKELSGRKPKIFDYMDIAPDLITLNCAKEFIIESISTGEKSAQLEKILNTIDLSKTLNESTTSVEKWSFDIFFDIYNNNGDNLRKLLNESSQFEESFTKGTWLMSHTYLTQISTLKTLDNLKRIKDKNSKQLIKQKLRDLRDRVDTIYINYSKTLNVSYENMIKGEKYSCILKQLNFQEFSMEDISSSILTVRKTVKNL
ncbi:hypothetical protein TBLA_0F01060 [Henningerozyma blattae CBS 6284]|uniref:N-terminal acetyltransferase B complex subunit MDM20 n=1 Tax=Henningerozyma blattae (strain ATCC 34711 / CBS 6284 / DSM 70876 / NBRC 10599 / NRRL Y-10934 / UCD 77-7) TaxID=1071380 RepID=I2H5J7_HENB6|nr:hypothetical protein TBLA_0F01060 [Tetrapisispora blattae CBS 6284]CCH61649.1 hypothetical protein TBLA_0F01060 [Tetrapisispora blattae CBS 6284]